MTTPGGRQTYINNIEQPKEPQKAGRKTTYKPEYCQDIIQFFDKPHFTNEVVERTTKPNGEVKEKLAKFPNTIPFFSEYAHTIGKTAKTLLHWCEIAPEFGIAYAHAKDLQRQMLIANGLNGLYNAQAYVFTAKNIAGMRDQIEQVQGISGELVDLLKELNGTSRGLPQYPKQIESSVVTPIIEPVTANQTVMSVLDDNKP